MVTRPEPPDMDTLWCPICDADRGFETPPCCDGHGPDCPDRACIECGTVLCVGLDSQTPPIPVRRSAA